MQRTPVGERETRRARGGIPEAQNADPVASDPAVVEDIVNPRTLRRTPVRTRRVSEQADSPNSSESRPSRVGSESSGTSLVPVCDQVMGGIVPPRPISSVAALSAPMIGISAPAVAQWDVEIKARSAKKIMLTHPRGRLTILVKLAVKGHLSLRTTEDSEVSVCGMYTTTTPAKLAVNTPLGRSDFIASNEGLRSCLVRFTVENLLPCMAVPAPSLLICGDVEANPGPFSHAPEELPPGTYDPMANWPNMEEFSYDSESDDDPFPHWRPAKPDPPEIKALLARQEAERLQRMELTPEKRAILEAGALAFKPASDAWKAKWDPIEKERIWKRDTARCKEHWDVCVRDFRGREPTAEYLAKVMRAELACVEAWIKNHKASAAYAAGHSQTPPKPAPAAAPLPKPAPPVEVPASAATVEPTAVTVQTTAIVVPVSLPTLPNVTEVVEAPSANTASDVESVDDPLATCQLPQDVVLDLQSRAARKDAFTDYYYVVCSKVGVPIANRYSLLCAPGSTDPECYTGILDDEWHSKPRNNQELVKTKGKSQPKTSPSGNSRSEEAPARKPKGDGEGQHPPPPVDPAVDKAQRRKLIVKRIAQRLRDQGSPGVLHWLEEHKPQAEFVRSVAAAMLGQHWQTKNKWSEVHLLFDEYLTGYEYEWMCGVKLLSLHPLHKEVMCQFKNAAALLAKSKLHNKVMHAYNGNTSQTPSLPLNSFTDVLNAKDVTMVTMATPSVSEYICFDHDFKVAMGMLLGFKSAEENRFDTADRMLFSNQDRTAAITAGLRPVIYPCSPLLPRQFVHPEFNDIHWFATEADALAREEVRIKVKAHNDAVKMIRTEEYKSKTRAQQAEIKKRVIKEGGSQGIDLPCRIEAGDRWDRIGGQYVTTRLKVWTLEQIPVPGLPLVPTSTATNLQNTISNDIGLSLKTNSLSLEGYQTPDLCALVQLSPYLGLTMELPVLKLMLLIEVLTWGQRWEAIPEAPRTLFDPNAIPVQADMELCVNACQIFGEDCGTTYRPVFPFVGTHGSLRLHTSLQTVAEEYRSSAIFLPNTLLGVNMCSGKALAILVIAFTEWPFCLFSYKQKVYHKDNKDEANIYDCLYTAAACLIRVAGTRNLNVILPSSNVETRGHQGRSFAPRWRPASGPVFTATLPAGTALPYCTMGNNGVLDLSTHLTEFLVSWATSITINDVGMVLGAINEWIPIGKTIACTRDIVNVVSYMYPKLILGKQNEYPHPPMALDGLYSTKVVMDYVASNHLSPHQLSKDFPVTETFSGDFMIQEFDVGAWNLCIMNLFVIDSPEGLKPAALRLEYIHPAVIQCNITKSIMFALAWQILLQWHGLGCRSWVTHDVNRESQWIALVTGTIFGTPAMRTSGTLARADYVLANIMRATTTITPTTTIWRFNDGTVRPVTIFSRTCDTHAYATVYSEEGIEYDGYIPTILQDAWLEMCCKWLPMGWLPYPAPESAIAAKAMYYKGPGSTEMFSRQQITYQDQPYESALYITHPLEYFSPICMHRLLDAERWNVRLFATDGRDFKLVSLTGKDFDGVDQTGRLPWGRLNFLREGEAPPVEHLGQATLCTPNADERNRKAYIIMPMADARSINNTGCGAGFANRARWMIPETIATQMLPVESKVIDDWYESVLRNNSGFCSVESVEPARVTPGVEDKTPDVEPPSSKPSKEPSTDTVAPTLEAK